MSDVLVNVQGLRVAFNEKIVVHGVDLCIHAGECVALVGESGSGKSVTARSLMNLVGLGSQVSATHFDVNGENALTFNDAKWRSVRGKFAGLVMQDALVSLDPLRHIGDEVAGALTEHRLLPNAKQVRHRVSETLSRVGMSDPDVRMQQYAHALSGGLRQRALIAAAVATGPRLIIADEPTTALDAHVQRQVVDLLAQRVKEDNVGLLLISHDLSMVAGIADKILVMYQGRVVEAGVAEHVLRHPRHSYTRQLIAAVPSGQSRGQRLSSARFEPHPHDNTLQVVRDRLPSRQTVTQEKVLQVDGITKFYKRGSGTRNAFAAVRDVSFDVCRGEVVGVVGQSGSGKSTCAKMVLGLLEPDVGQIRVLGKPWSGIAESTRKPMRSQLQYIPQDPLSSFDPRYRVYQVIAENMNGVAPSDVLTRIHELLEQVGLPHTVAQQFPRHLSGGQRQRVAIARALAAEPAIIVCDEPVSALDISIQAQVIDLIADLQARLMTSLLFISHDLPLVHHIADRVVVMRDGCIVEQGNADQVFTNPTHEYTRQLLQAMPSRLASSTYAPS